MTFGLDTNIQILYTLFMSHPVPEIFASVSSYKLFLYFGGSTVKWSFRPPGGAVYQVWDARPTEFYHQAEGRGGQRGAEAQKKVETLKTMFLSV